MPPRAMNSKQLMQLLKPASGVKIEATSRATSRHLTEIEVKK
jgi:hypothetical protein